MQTTLATLAIVATLVSSGIAISCHQCNSHKPGQEDCLNLTMDSTKYLVDCDNQAELPDKMQYDLCRKLDMHLDIDYGSRHRPERRIDRDCGFVEDNEGDSRQCYFKSGYHTKSYVCACTVDGCNGASFHTASFFLSTTLLSLMAVVFKLMDRY